MSQKIEITHNEVLKFQPVDKKEGDENNCRAAYSIFFCINFNYIASVALLLRFDYVNIEKQLKIHRENLQFYYSCVNFVIDLV